MFDRFGLISYQALPLEGFGLRRKWKKLDKLQHEAEGLIDRYQEAAAKVAELEQERPAARDRDLDAHATALRKGEQIPESEHEAGLDKDLAGAIRTRDALQRAVEGAMADVTSYRLEHASALQQDIVAALEAKAQTLAEHARAAAALYAEVEDGKTVARQFAPAPPPASENTDAPQDSVVILGPLVRGNITGGPARGTVEEILRYLASIEGQFGTSEVDRPSEATGEAASERGAATTTIIGGV